MYPFNRFRRLLLLGESDVRGRGIPYINNWERRYYVDITMSDVVSKNTPFRGGELIGAIYLIDPISTPDSR